MAATRFVADIRREDRCLATRFLNRVDGFLRCLSLRSTTKTRAPSDASLIAMARPIPTPAPVTSATFPSSSATALFTPIVVMVNLD